MSADDDEDYWSNDDFIATIENVVKKAEEARAARQGGTQFAPTPNSSAPVPPHSANFRIGEAGTSFTAAQDSHHVPEFLSSGPSHGSVAAVPWDVHSRTISRGLYGENTIADLRGIPHQSIQDVSASLQTRGEADAVGEDGGGHYGEMMAEKDGLISILRSRILEAERQLDELRNRVVPQNLSHPSVYQQQLELERLSVQLMFKDHEIIEGQRARAEKEQRHNDALAETAALKAELESLKKSSGRQTGAELKRPRNEADTEVSGDVIARPIESTRCTSGVSMLNHDPWSPPWIPEGVPDPARNTTSGLRLTPQGESPNIETAKLRIEGNGSISLNGWKESTKADILQANESHKRGMSRRTGTSTSERSDGEEPPAIEHLNGHFSRTSEMYYSLQHLWGLKGVRNDGISLLSKLYASCRQDLYILFSDGESQVVKNLRSSNRETEGQSDGGTISEKLHTALAKVANGLAHPKIIITPLLEFCKLDNVNLVGSALHVLRCILQHDSTCRRSLLLRRSHQLSDCQGQPSSSYKTLEEKIAEDKGWCIQGAPNEGSSCSVMFSSPRIKFHSQAGDNFVQYTHGRKFLAENSGDKGGQEPHRDSDQSQRQVSEDREAGFDDTLFPAEAPNLLVKWLLDLALTSLSPIVKFEAISNLGVLVTSSEPLTERSMFGPLLCHGAIDLLLKESSKAEIQLQAVRIVHLLLHCPAIIERFCAEDDGNETMMIHSNLVDGRDAGTFPHLDNQTDKPPVSHNQGSSVVKTVEKPKMAVRSDPHQSYYTELSKVKVVEALTECLKYNGNCAQVHALHRSVIRLLAFIMAFGEPGAAALMRAGASCENPEQGTTSKDDAKVERVVGGESASGQNIVGDGSGLSHLKGQDLGDKENGIPTGMVDESVDDSEKPQNIPQRLLALIDCELDAEDREEWNDPSIAEERDHLIREAVTLLCSLSSDPVQSPVVLGHLISNKDMTRLTLSVTNRLLSRTSHSKHSWARQMSSAPNNFDVAELARGLRGRALRTLEETSSFSFY